MHPLANPVLIAVLLIVRRWSHAHVVPDVLRRRAVRAFPAGPAVVAWQCRSRAVAQRSQAGVPIAGALVVGMTVAVVSRVGIADLLGASPVTILSLAPKSVTAPIAMGIAEKMGGMPALAAVFAVTTGILGAALGKYVLDACRVRDLRARGFALGSPRTASAPRAHSRSTPKQARSPAWPSHCTAFSRPSSSRSRIALWSG